jgi:inorganic pyrophosphatase
MDENTEKLFNITLCVLPVAFYILLAMLGFGTIIRFMLVALLVSIEALIYSFKVLAWLLNLDDGTPEMKEIANTIVEGSEGFFKAQYGTIFKMSFLIASTLVIAYLFKDNSTIIKELDGGVGNISLALFTGYTFMLGALCSALSGFAGMWVSVRANLRVASAATSCYNTSIVAAFKGGYFAAAINVALAIFGISTMYLTAYFYMGIANGFDNIRHSKIPLLAIGFGFGASFVAMFAQLGGGIYTKAADVGADLIGKVEAGIPEDDPRNPAVIADLVGDNVGDCAGQAADLFESKFTYQENYFNVKIILSLFLNLNF